MILNIQTGYLIPNFNTIISVAKVNIYNLEYIFDKFYDFEDKFDKVEDFIK